eukprot:COSAG05_NODE_6071_length_1027_cov_1.251078_1_plen_342_part_11
MKHGMIKSIRSGKKTEGKCLEEATDSLAKMKAGGNKKKGGKEGKPKARMARATSEPPKLSQGAFPAGMKHKAPLVPPEQIVQQLASSDASVSLGAAKHIDAIAKKLRGPSSKEFQDSLTAALGPLAEMAASREQLRSSAAFAALYRLLAYHKRHTDTMATSSLADAAAAVLGSVDSTAELKANACNVLHTLATNSFESHQKIVHSGLIDVLVKSLYLAGDKTTVQTTVHSLSCETDGAVLSAEQLQHLTKLVGEGDKVCAIVRGLPGSGKTSLVKGITAHLGSGLVCSADSYFLAEDGTFQFDHKRIKDAHAFSKVQFEEALALEAPVIIIDNTNVKLKEYA